MKFESKLLFSLPLSLSLSLFLVVNMRSKQHGLLQRQRGHQVNGLYRTETLFLSFILETHFLWWLYTCFISTENYRKTSWWLIQKEGALGQRWDNGQVQPLYGRTCGESVHQWNLMGKRCWKNYWLTATLQWHFLYKVFVPKKKREKTTNKQKTSKK